MRPPACLSGGSLFYRQPAVPAKKVGLRGASDLLIHQSNSKQDHPTADRWRLFDPKLGRLNSTPEDLAPRENHDHASRQVESTDTFPYLSREDSPPLGEAP